MRHPLVHVCALLLLLCTADALAQMDGKETRARPLNCDESRPDGCEVSCETPSGEVAFVHTGMRAVVISELEGAHALLELQYERPEDSVTLLVSDVSKCSFEGIGDTELRPPQLPPDLDTVTPPPPPSPPEVTVNAGKSGGGTLWPGLLLALATILAARGVRCRHPCRARDSDPATH